MKSYVYKDCYVSMWTEQTDRGFAGKATISCKTGGVWSATSFAHDAECTSEDECIAALRKEINERIDEARLFSP